MVEFVGLEYWVLFFGEVFGLRVIFEVFSYNKIIIGNLVEFLVFKIVFIRC